MRKAANIVSVMAGQKAFEERRSSNGYVPAIHVFFCAGKQDVDARPKAGHDAESEEGAMP